MFAGCRQISAPTQPAPMSQRVDFVVSAEPPTNPLAHQFQVRLDNDNWVEDYNDPRRVSGLFPLNSGLTATIPDIPSTPYLVRFEWDEESGIARTWTFAPVEVNAGVLRVDLAVPNTRIDASILVTGSSPLLSRSAVDLRADSPWGTWSMIDASPGEVVFTRTPSGSAALTVIWRFVSDQQGWPIRDIRGSLVGRIELPDSVRVPLELIPVVIRIRSRLELPEGSTSSVSWRQTDVGSWRDLYFNGEWSTGRIRTLWAAPGRFTVDIFPPSQLSDVLPSVFGYFEAAEGDTIEVKLGEYFVRIQGETALGEPAAFRKVRVIPVDPNQRDLTKTTGMDGVADFVLNGGSYEIVVGDAIRRRYEVFSDTTLMVVE